jgi:hypothetical protein
MSTKPRRFAERVSAWALCALAAGALLATRARSSDKPMEPAFGAAYPHAPVPGGAYAGVALDKLELPGLRLAFRENHAVDEGGVVLSYADQGGEVRAVVKLAVARDAASARRFVDVELHGVQVTLPRAIDAAFGDHAFADDGGRGSALVVGAKANVAFAVHVDRDASSASRASDVVRGLLALLVEGAPSFPSVSLALPPRVPVSGARLQVAAAGLTPQLRADGGYVAHGKAGFTLKPFHAGPVAVIATVVDELGRVTEQRAEALAE